MSAMMKQARRTRDAADRVTRVRVIACACAICLAMFLPQMAWAKANASGEPGEETSCDVTQDETAEPDEIALSAATQNVWRLYNRWSGEHLYTTDRSEYDGLGRRGWDREDVAWTAPSSGSSSNPVWRLYNRWSGDHLLTSDRREYDTLGRRGWNQEGIAFHSGGSVSVWRLYNRWLKAGTHLLTTDKTEYDNLVRDGWSGEGVAFYAVSARSGQTDSQRREAEMRAAINRNPTSVNNDSTITVTGKAVAESLQDFDGSTAYSVQLQRPLTIRNIPPSTVDTTPTETTNSLVLVKWLGFGYIDWWNEPQKWFASHVGKTVTVTGRVVWRRSGKLMSYGPWLYDARLVRVW